MNKVFRVIWSEAQGAWVAVSETTKSHSKRSRKHALALALTAGSLMTISGAAVAKGTFVPGGEASVAITSATCSQDTAADGKNSVSIGCGAGAGAEGEFSGSKAEGDTSIGYQAGIGVKGKENTAIGSNAGESVIGNDNTAFGVSAGKLVKGDKNVSLGFNSGFSLSGKSNISVGDASGGSIHGDNNVMLGTAAKVKGSAADNRISDTVLIGTKASASSSDNVAIGKDTQATHANSVALGHASVTSEAKAITEGSIVDSAGTTHTYSGFAGVGSQANGAVSVGALGAERQIVNVAAGAITSSSTDAVNGSQLYGVAKGLNDQVNDLGSSVAGSLGGGSKYEGGKVSADLTVGGKNYTNVQDALNNIGGGWVLGSKAADGTTDQDLTIATGKKVDFNAGTNMEITSEQDADGNVVSTFKTKDDVAFTSVTTGGTVMNDNGLTIKVDDGAGGLKDGPSITKAGINAGDLNITNVKAGTADTHGVNVSQLKGVANVIGGVTVDANGNYTGPTFKVNNTTNTTIAGAIAELDKGWTFTAGGETDQVQAGDKVSLEAGKNMLITSTKDADGNITSTFLTKDAVEFDSVKTGDSLLNNAGLTVGANVSVTNQGFTAGDVSLTVDGINAGNKKITNVAAGTELTDGVNVSQLEQVQAQANKGWKLGSKDATNTNDLTLDVAPDGQVNLDAGKNMQVTSERAADGTVTTTFATKADVKFDSVTLGDITQPGQYTQLTQGGLNIGGNTFVNNGGLTFNNSSVSVSANGINAGGNKIINVAKGEDDSDAVNVGQLKDYVGKNDGSWNISNGTTSSKVATGNTVTIAGSKTGTTAGNINVTHDGNGNLTIESNANVKHDNVTVGETTINKDTGITVGDTNINNQGDITVGDKVSVNKDGVTVGDVTINKDTGITVGGTNINNQGDITVGDVSITVDGGINAGDKKITGVADGTIAAGSKDAVNGGQIHDMQVQIDQQAGGWELNDGKGGKQQVKAGDSVAIVGGDNINVEFDTDGKMVVETTPDVTHNSVTTGDTVMNDNGVTIKDGPSITKNGVDAGDKKITSVAKGEISETSTDAINGSQLNETNNRVTKNEGDIKNIQNGKDGMFQVSQDYNAPAPEPTGKKSAAGGAGAVASGDNSTAIGNDAKATASNSTALGNSALASANNSVALGQGSVADRANSVSVGTVGGERQITNVAAGVAPTDAVNVSQLDALGSKVNQYFNAANKRIDKVDNNARAGIAAAMAAGTLPQSTLPGKSMVTVGASTYRGESALAIGVSRLSDNARTVIKANASADSRGNAGAAVGVGWHW